MNQIQLQPIQLVSPWDVLNAGNQFHFMLYIWSCSSSYVVAAQ